MPLGEYILDTSPVGQKQTTLHCTLPAELLRDKMDPNKPEVFFRLHLKAGMTTGPHLSFHQQGSRLARGHHHHRRTMITRTIHITAVVHHNGGYTMVLIHHGENTATYETQYWDTNVHSRCMTWRGLVKPGYNQDMSSRTQYTHLTCLSAKCCRTDSTVR